MLDSARAATQRKTTSTAARSTAQVTVCQVQAAAVSCGTGRTTPPEGIDPAKLATLQSYSRKLNEGLHQQGWMQVKTLRFRPKGENIDRKFVVESSLDPMDNTAVILRVRPATTAELPEPGPKYLTTGAGREGPERLSALRHRSGRRRHTQGRHANGANHRRIPEPEVLRMRELMHTQMRKGIQEIEEFNGDLRQRELDEARKTVTRRWVAKAP